MILNRSHFPWAILVCLISAVCTIFYVANTHSQSLPASIQLPAWFGPVPPIRNSYGGTPFGLLLGAASLFIFVFASSLGIRKKRRLWRIGNVQLWLKAHIWLTILTIPLILLHSGFRHGGPMTSTILILYAIVMLSGFFGLAMQQFMPRLMTTSLPRETVYEQIPHMRQLIVEAAEAFRKTLEPAPVKVEAGGAVEPAAPPAEVSVFTQVRRADHNEQLLREFLDAECLPYLRSSKGKASRLEVQKSASNVFRLLKLGVEQTWWEKVDTLQLWCDERRQMDLQAYLHHWLHGWLLIHVPLSFALLLLAFWHAYITAIYL